MDRLEKVESYRIRKKNKPDDKPGSRGFAGQRQRRCGNVRGEELRGDEMGRRMEETLETGRDKVIAG
jgi:hypothetical protein